MSAMQTCTSPGEVSVGPKKVWYAPNQFEAYDETEIKAVEECLRAGACFSSSCAQQSSASCSFLSADTCFF